MSYPINYPTPQGANVQIFYAPSSTATSLSSWIKPQGASFVWFTLIGAGGNGNGTNGGGSGAVTNFMCPAFLIPDNLQVRVAIPSSNSQVIYQQKNGAGYQLLVANSAVTITGATASTSNNFTAMGFFQSVAGQNGATGDVTASTTTFLSGGGGSASGSNIVTGNYGYSQQAYPGFFQMQPIIVGLGGPSGGSSAKGGIGCGSGDLASGNNTGGNGLVVIITW